MDFRSGKPWKVFAVSECVFDINHEGHMIILYNKAFRERQYPQPLDQWTNSPFMGQ